jgi:hypothetical protein
LVQCFDFAGRRDYGDLRRDAVDDQLEVELAFMQRFLSLLQSLGEVVAGSRFSLRNHGQKMRLRRPKAKLIWY